MKLKQCCIVGSTNSHQAQLPDQRSLHDTTQWDNSRHHMRPSGHTRPHHTGNKNLFADLHEIEIKYSEKVI